MCRGFFPSFACPRTEENKKIHETSTKCFLEKARGQVHIFFFPFLGGGGQIIILGDRPLLTTSSGLGHFRGRKMRWQYDLHSSKRKSTICTPPPRGKVNLHPPFRVPLPVLFHLRHCEWTPPHLQFPSNYDTVAVGFHVEPQLWHCEAGLWASCCCEHQVHADLLTRDVVLSMVTDSCFFFKTSNYYLVLFNSHLTQSLSNPVLGPEVMVLIFVIFFFKCQFGCSNANFTLSSAGLSKKKSKYKKKTAKWQKKINRKMKQKCSKFLRKSLRALHLSQRAHNWHAFSDLSSLLAWPPQSTYSSDKPLLLLLSIHSPPPWTPPVMKWVSS